MKSYNHKTIEEKWRKRWLKDGLYEAGDEAKKKFYHLVMFAYPSGDLHIGHWYNFAPADVVARRKRMEGWNVLSPFGFDAFGLPAENAAIKRKLHPKKWTYDNIARMRRQLRAMGSSYDWSREVITADPAYYKWTQWMFLQLFKKGLAYRNRVPANWCPSCKTVLANEQVIDGRCDRCESEVARKNIEQWMFKITAYADELLKDLDALDWPEKTKTMQRNWIGRSEGANIKFKIQNSKFKTENQNAKLEDIVIFTTRPDTIFGATYLVLAPEHPFVAAQLEVENQKSKIKNSKEVEEYIKKAAKKTERERTATDREKTGVELEGIAAINPATKKEIPVWISDYVLGHYGTGAIMAVPAHDQRDYEFAKKHNLPVEWVIVGTESKIGNEAVKAWQDIVGDHAYAEEGWMKSSGKFTGMPSNEAGPTMISWMEREGWGRRAVTYKLHDWIVSRQRYWGTPIPILYCAGCAIQNGNSKSKIQNPKQQWNNVISRNGKIVAVMPVPESELPVLLPDIDDYTPPGDGMSPLARSKKFVKAPCPQCGLTAERETDTMDTFVDSSWYFLRYADPNNNKEFASKSALKKWLPVDLYIGGSEHATMHLLYARFLVKALADMNYLSFREPFTALRHQGIILGENGEKMSKSRGNVVDPDALVDAYGADAVRLYLCFMSEYAQGGPWNPGGINGVSRFLGRVWRLFKETEIQNTSGKDRDVAGLLHQTIKKVSDDIDNFRFNTAVSSLMIMLRKLEGGDSDSESREIFLKLLAPFAPFITEEVWHEALKKKSSIHTEPWPKYDRELAQESTYNLAVQINGKTRGTVELTVDAIEADALGAIKNNEKFKKYLKDKTIKKTIFVKNRIINIVA